MGYFAFVAAAFPRPYIRAGDHDCGAAHHSTTTTTTPPIGERAGSSCDGGKIQDKEGMLAPAMVADSPSLHS